MRFSGYTCWECEFYKDGLCELNGERVGRNKLACRDFELG